MTTGRIVIIPFLHGKFAVDGTVVEPDIDAILEKWLERHPEFRGREFHIIRGRTTLVDEDVETDLVRVTTDFTLTLRTMTQQKMPICTKSSSSRSRIRRHLYFARSGSSSAKRQRGSKPTTARRRHWAI